MPRRYFLILFFISGFCNAGFLPDAQREELSKLVLKNFWGKAKLANGDFVRPSSEAERNILPISDFVADRVIDAGEISGLGDWCKLDWESHYLSMTKAARSNGMTGKQVAFISVLHGAAQERIFSIMSKKSSCDEQYRGKVQKMLRQSEEKASTAFN